MASILQVHPADDAIVALCDLDSGASVSLNGHRWTLREKIPAKQKFAAKDFAVGDLVTMYGVTVGRATQPIAA
ncbi:MAG TPA: UxaA family hydrolase, partial [Prosthecobacter sp.]|nr:UxaA family hydrolase [Prosthecobacter sp.]